MNLFTYLDLNISKDLKFLYLVRILLQIAFGMVGLFLPIFFYTKFSYSFTAVILIFIINFSLVFFLYPLSAKMLNRIDMKWMMVMSIPFALISMLVLYFWDYSPYFIATISVLMIVIYKILYWTPYHVDFAKFTDNDMRGRQISLLRNISQLVGIITPFISGIIITFFTFKGAFLASVIVFILSMVPAFFIKKTRENFSWGYFETFKKLFHKKNRDLLIAYMADGAQTVVTAIVWPIFIFLLLNGEYLIVGIISSVTVFAIIVIRMIIGDLIDTWNQKKMLVIGSTLNTFGWIIKLFIETAFQIFVADTFHNMGRVVHRTSVDTTQYDQAVDNGHYIDEYTVLRELALNIGRILMLSLAFVISLFFSIKFIFIFAAIATILVVFLNKQHVISH